MPFPGHMSYRAIRPGFSYCCVTARTIATLTSLPLHVVLAQSQHAFKHELCYVDLLLSLCFSFFSFWPTVLLVEPLVHFVICHHLSVTFCIVTKRYVLAKNCLKEWIGNWGQKVYFLGRRHISTSGFASTATETAVFALFLPVQPSNRY